MQHNMKYEDAAEMLQRSCDGGLAQGCVELIELNIRARRFEQAEAARAVACRLDGRSACEVNIRRIADRSEEKKCSKGHPRACLVYWVENKSNLSVEQQQDYLQKSCDGQFADGCVHLAMFHHQRRMHSKARQAYSDACNYGSNASCLIAFDDAKRRDNGPASIGFARLLCGRGIDSLCSFEFVSREQLAARRAAKRREQEVAATLPSSPKYLEKFLSAPPAESVAIAEAKESFAEVLVANSSPLPGSTKANGSQPQLAPAAESNRDLELIAKALDENDIKKIGTVFFDTGDYLKAAVFFSEARRRDSSQLEPWLMELRALRLLQNASLFQARRSEFMQKYPHLAALPILDVGIAIDGKPPVTTNDSMDFINRLEAPDLLRIGERLYRQGQNSAASVVLKACRSKAPQMVQAWILEHQANKQLNDPKVLQATRQDLERSRPDLLKLQVFELAH
jgi:tetratricopeptide (TPR) repeat protein